MCQWYNIRQSVPSPAAGGLTIDDDGDPGFLAETPPDQNDVLVTSSDEGAIIESNSDRDDHPQEPPHKRRKYASHRVDVKSLEVLGFQAHRHNMAQHQPKF